MGRPDRVFTEAIASLREGSQQARSSRVAVGFDEAANTATPLLSQATASPSIRHDRTLSWFTASTISRYRGAQSWPVPLRPPKTPQGHGVIGNGVTVTGAKLLPSLAPVVCYR